MRALLIMLLVPSWAFGAQGPGNAPADAASLAWQQRPGATLPLQTGFTDDAGRPATLGHYFGRRPVILDIGYFHCPSLCGVVRADLFDALSKSGLVPGRDYSLLSISIDQAETPATAAQTRQADEKAFSIAGSADVHYLTGSPQAISAVSGAVGFRARYDARFRQFLHPSGLVFLTQAGVVSGYVLGVGYSPGDVRTAVLRAQAGGIARAALPILLLCFHFDPATGRYTLAIMKLLRLMGVLTVGAIAALLIILHRSGAKARA